MKSYEEFKKKLMKGYEKHKEAFKSKSDPSKGKSQSDAAYKKIQEEVIPARQKERARLEKESKESVPLQKRQADAAYEKAHAKMLSGNKKREEMTKMLRKKVEGNKKRSSGREDMKRMGRR